MWDWGGIALYSVLSVLNAMWFGRVCSMLIRGLRKRKAPQARPSTLVLLSSAKLASKLPNMSGQLGIFGMQKGIENTTSVFPQQYDWPKRQMRNLELQKQEHKLTALY